MTLDEFLLARIAEDEAAARAAYSEGTWRSGTTYTAFPSVEARSWTVAANLERTDADHIARHDPARVLAECQARRWIVEAYVDDDNRGRYGGCGDDCEWKALNYALRCLALPYADHPDYDEEWRP